MTNVLISLRAIDDGIWYGGLELVAAPPVIGRRCFSELDNEMQIWEFLRNGF